jgi:hypothetical protein
MKYDSIFFQKCVLANPKIFIPSFFGVTLTTSKTSTSFLCWSSGAVKNKIDGGTIWVPAIIYRVTLPQWQWLRHRHIGGSNVPSTQAENTIQYQRALPGGSTDRRLLRIVVKSTYRWYRYLRRGPSFDRKENCYSLKGLKQ